MRIAVENKQRLQSGEQIQVIRIFFGHVRELYSNLVERFIPFLFREKKGSEMRLFLRIKAISVQHVHCTYYIPLYIIRIEYYTRNYEDTVSDGLRFLLSDVLM